MTAAPPDTPPADANSSDANSSGSSGPGSGGREREASILAAAMPWIHHYRDAVFVIKYGGDALGNPAATQGFARDLVCLKQVGIHPVVVHGGGPQIAEMLGRLGIEPDYVEGVRVTDAETLRVVEMVLGGAINKQLAAAITREGGCGIGLTGKDGRLITAHKLTRHRPDPDSNIERTVDLGYVGEVRAIDPDMLRPLMAGEGIPVIAPIGLGDDDLTYTINADAAAGALAGAFAARRLIVTSDAGPVRDRNGAPLRHLSTKQAGELIRDGVVQDGMLSRLQACLDSLRQGTHGAVILDGAVPHALLLEIFTEAGLGTLIEEAG